MIKSSNYTRELTKKEIGTLQARYEGYCKRKRRGFLSTNEKEKLLRIKKWQDADDQEIYQFFYDIRESAITAFSDFLLLCETLNEKQIIEIFSNDIHVNDEMKLLKTPECDELERFRRSHPLFKYVVEFILSDRSKFKSTKTEKELKSIYDDAWQAYLAHDLIRICLNFFREHGFISTKAHERLADEVEDMINVEVSRGIKLKRHQRSKGFV